MKGIKFVSQFADRMDRSRFTYFPDLPKHVQEYIIVCATKLKVPKLFRWLVVLRSVNGLFNDTVDLKGGWATYIARYAFMTSYGHQIFSSEKAYYVRLRLLELALENEAFFKYLGTYLKYIIHNAATFQYEIMFKLFKKVVKSRPEDVDTWYNTLLRVFPNKFFYIFKNIDLERTIHISQAHTPSITRELLLEGYVLQFNPKITTPITITNSQWRKILTIGHRSTIDFLLEHVYNTNERHYKQLVEWAKSFETPKKKRKMK